MKINSPHDGFTGRTTVGPYVLEFKDGVAEVDELNDGARAYLKSKGYGFGSHAGHLDDVEQPEPADPRKVSTEKVGDPVRDAAVNPRESDFLAPTNAGEANPHGPKVVSPEVHASQGTRPVKGGDVHVDDPDAQDAAETAHAEASTDGTAVPGSKPAGELKGAALDEALEAAGLPNSGTADEKRARLAEHRGEA